MYIVCCTSALIMYIHTFLLAVKNAGKVYLVVALLPPGGAVSEFTPTVYPAKIFPSSQCGQHIPYYEQLREVLQQIEQNIPKNTTCKCILDNYPSAPSGYYNITTNGSTVLVYCDMEGTNCGGEGGWTRVAYVNMTQPGATCPQGLNQTSYNNKTLWYSVTMDMVVPVQCFPH